ncbi:MAG TPA: acyl-CoA dehydrogenase [Burkholderiales bacterium]|jgi:alkylation response protein AidB-like acyl-CoA dehydrogenase|nr:acyl-CoA dehydrogenase [Burkholderiales bacterium]
MQSMLLNPRDLAFVLYELLDVEALTRRPRYAEHSRETFDAALETARRIAEEKFAPHNRKADLSEPRFVDGRVEMIPEVAEALRAFCDAGFMAAAREAELGGMQLPWVVAQACFAWFNAANVSTAAYPFLTVANANLIEAFGTPAQKARYLAPLLEGRWFGTMCLSEPQAGSSLGDIRTTAHPQPDGSYRLSGNKMWISGGDHELSENIVHLVLARIQGAPAGVKGISLFIVPKYRVGSDGARGERNDVALAGLNHKMGFRGTTNCVLNFGEQGGAWGELVGEPNKGLACMFHMMNEARIGVGMGATVLGYTGYLHALDYARQRPQGRLPGAKDPAQPPVKIIEHADVRRMLLAQKAYVEGALGLCLQCARLVDEQHTGDEQARREAGLLLEVLTPIAKAWPSHWCLEANSLAIQVHGGYGYTREYPVEQFYRDNRLNPIHEGTNGIQALDLLGRKAGMLDGAALQLLAREIATTIRRAGECDSPELRSQGDALNVALDRVMTVTRNLLCVTGRGEVELGLANASAYLDLVGHTVLAWVWLKQGLASVRGLAGADAHDRDFYQGKLQACAWFFRWELPKTRQWAELLDSLDRTTLEMQDAWF